MAYIYLAIAVFGEVVATSSLKESAEFTRLVPSILVVVGYSAAFYFMMLTLRTIPVGITYAIWSGLGIVLVAVVAAVWHKQIPDVPAMLGMALIIAGVVVIQLFSKMVQH